MDTSRLYSGVVVIFTFVGATGNSVVDYIICSQHIFSRLKQFNVAERTESSHFPLSICFDIGHSILDSKDIGHDKHYHTKYVFNDDIIQQFREAINSRMTNEFVSGKITNTSNDVDDIQEELNSLINDSSIYCVKSYHLHNSEQPKWFDGECKKLKVENIDILHSTEEVSRLKI